MADGKGIAELLTELGYPASPEAAVARLARVSNDPSSRVLVAEVAGEVVGLVATHFVPRLDEDRLSCRVIDLVVRSDHRRSGIGTALISAAEAEARRQQATRLDLSSGDWRPEAHAFYARLGFESRARSYVKRL